MSIICYIVFAYIIVFVNIFPVSISEIALEWGSNDTIEEFTVEFGYDYWTHAEASDTTS